MSIFASLFGNNQSTTSQTQSIAQPAADVAANLFARANAFANQPYTPYGGAREAGFTPDQMRAFDITRDVSGTGGDLYSRLSSAILGDAATRPVGAVNDAAGRMSGLGALGATAAQNLATRFPDANISEYMNPYVQQVLDPALNDLTRRAEQTKAALRATSARTGSFGGSRNAIALAEADRNTEMEIGRLSANERARAFNEAANQFRLDQERIPGLFAAGQALERGGIEGQGLAEQFRQMGYQNIGNLIGQNTGRLTSQVNPLLATGGLQQALQQANLDRAYSDFVEQRDWGARGLSSLMGALGVSGGATGATTRTVAESPRPNAIGQVLGAGAGLLGSLGGLSGLGNLASSAGNWISGLFSPSTNVPLEGGAFGDTGFLDSAMSAFGFG